MDSCINHPDHAAIEHCEVCGDPLCDLCLWYAGDGRRLCEAHARKHEAGGGEVQSPELYHGSIRLREVEEVAEVVPYRGTGTDVTAAAAVLIGATSVMSFFGATMCLPLLAAVLGFIALADRHKSFDPDRTRTMGILGIVLAFASFLPFLFFFCMFFFIMSISLVSATVTGP